MFKLFYLTLAPVLLCYFLFLVLGFGTRVLLFSSEADSLTRCSSFPETCCICSLTSRSTRDFRSVGPKIDNNIDGAK